MRKILLLIFLSPILISACASSGFNRGELQKQINVGKPQYDDNAIKDAYNKKPNLPKKFKLAFYFKPSNSADWRWTEDDRAKLDGLIQSLKSKGVISEAFPILNSLVDAEGLQNIRLVAAKHQADAVLIVGGAGQLDRYINNWGWTYTLLLPAFFVKGSEADALFMTNAALWDVKNEYLYLTAEAESISKQTHIAAFGKSDKEMLLDAKKESLTKLSAELQKMAESSKL